jgi:hypothetical protein
MTMSSHPRCKAFWFLGLCLLAFTMLSAIPGAAHNKQNHVVTGAMVGGGGAGWAAVFRIDNATEKGTAIVKFSSELRTRSVTIKCAQVFVDSIRKTHWMWASGKSPAGPVYLLAQEGKGTLGTVSLSKTEGPAPCGGNGLSSPEFRAYVSFAKG